MNSMGAMVRLLEAIKSRIRLMIGRGVLALVDDDRLMQELQVKLLSGEVMSGVEHWQPYGYTYHPHPQGEALMVFPKADRSHGICIAVGDLRYRIKPLAEGEVALYTDEDGGAGHRIHLKRGNEVHLVAGASSIVMTPAGITITTPQLDIVKAV